MITAHFIQHMKGGAVLENLINNLIPMCQNALNEGKQTFGAIVLQYALDNPAMGLFFAFLIIRGIKKKLHC